MMAQEPVVGDMSPWGEIEGVEQVMPGIIHVSTASHGGLWLSEINLTKMTWGDRYFAADWSHGWGDHWWEEDSAAARVMKVFDPKCSGEK